MLVYTQDAREGEIRLRRVRKSPFGKYVVNGVMHTTDYLCADGKMSGKTYIQKWTSANKKAEALSFLLQLEK